MRPIWVILFLNVYGVFPTLLGYKIQQLDDWEGLCFQTAPSTHDAFAAYQGQVRSWYPFSTSLYETSGAAYEALIIFNPSRSRTSLCLSHSIAEFH